MPVSLLLLCVHIYLSLSVCRTVCQLSYLPVCHSVFPSACPPAPICPYTCLPSFLPSVCLFVPLSVCRLATHLPTCHPYVLTVPFASSFLVSFSFTEPFCIELFCIELLCIELFCIEMFRAERSAQRCSSESFLHGVVACICSA